MDIEVSFPGGKRVDARVGGFTIATDQPTDLGGGGAAPAPFDLFLASMATCAGIYVLAFFQARGLPTEGLTLRQAVETDPQTKLPTRFRIEVRLPHGFPEKYRSAVVRAAEGCKVKRTMAALSAFEVVATTPEGELAAAGAA